MVQFWNKKKPLPPAEHEDLRSSEMQEAIAQWEDIFSGRPDWATPKHPDTLNLASAATRYLTRLTCAELSVQCRGSARAARIGEVMERQVLPQFSAAMQQAMAGGCVVWKPYVADGNISVEWLRADEFYPIEQSPDGRVTAAVFLEHRRFGERDYLRLETHRPTKDGGYEILQQAFEDENGAPGKPVSLYDIPAWRELVPHVRVEHIEAPLFAVLRMPFANTVDGSAQPVSLYASAVSTLRDLDRLYGDYRFEFSSARRKLILREDALRLRADGSAILPQEEGAADVYLPLDFGTEGAPFGDYTPAIREAQYREGIHELLRLYELQTGVSPGTFSLDEGGKAITATEVLSKDRKTYYTVHEMQQQGKEALKDLAAAIDAMLSLYRLAPSGKWELCVEFGDSVFEDTATEFERRRQLVELGMRPELLLAWYFKTTEEDAAAMLHQTKGEDNGSIDMDAGTAPRMDRGAAADPHAGTGGAGHSESAARRDAGGEAQESGGGSPERSNRGGI